MDINIFSFLVLVLAVDMVMVIWFKGSLFATPRAIVQTWADRPGFVRKKFGELLSCPLCLPPHLAIWLFLVGTFIPFGFEALFIIAAAGLASRLSNSIWPMFPFGNIGP